MVLLATLLLAAPIAIPTSTTAKSTPPADLLTEALLCIGYERPEDVLSDFSMLLVHPSEVAVCPDREGEEPEPCCVRVLGEKDETEYISPFVLTNPYSVTFDGWRAGTQPWVIGWDQDQAKIPPDGPWLTEGITIRGPLPVQPTPTPTGTIEPEPTPPADLLTEALLCIGYERP